jgi:hypothetical protein
VTDLPTTLADGERGEGKVDLYLTPAPQHCTIDLVDYILTGDLRQNNYF